MLILCTETFKISIVLNLLQKTFLQLTAFVCMKKRSEQMPEFGMPSTQCSRKRHVDGEHKKIVNNDKPPW